MAALRARTRVKSLTLKHPPRRHGLARAPRIRTPKLRFWVSRAYANEGSDPSTSWGRGRFPNFYRAILDECAERDAAAVEVAFGTRGATAAQEAAQALRDLQGEAANDLLGAYRDAKRLANRAAAQWLAEARGETLAAVVDAIRDTQAEQGATLGRIDENAAIAARMARGLQNPVDVKTAAALCGVTERTIRNWIAGKGTPIGWPGLASFEALKTFAESFTAFKGANKAIQRNPERYNPNLARHNPQ